MSRTPILPQAIPDALPTAIPPGNSTHHPAIDIAASKAESLGGSNLTADHSRFDRQWTNVGGEQATRTSQSSIDAHSRRAVSGQTTESGPQPTGTQRVRAAFGSNFTLNQQQTDIQSRSVGGEA